MEAVHGVDLAPGSPIRLPTAAPSGTPRASAGVEPDDPGELLLVCANCGARMDERKCKLICRCGYFLSCSTTTDPPPEAVVTEGVRVPPIELVVDTGADPDTAWRTLTEPARVALWLTAASEPRRVGDSYRLDFGEGSIVRGEIVVLDPGQRVRAPLGVGRRRGRRGHARHLDRLAAGRRVAHLAPPRRLAGGRARRHGARRPCGVLGGLPRGPSRRPRGGVSTGGRLGSLRYRAYGQYQRDARLILVTSLVAGAAVSLYWIDFNLYLASLGLTTATIGLVATLGSAAAALVAFPAARRRTGVGRRTAFLAGIGASLVALVALLASEALPVIVLAARCGPSATRRSRSSSRPTSPSTPSPSTATSCSRSSSRSSRSPTSARPSWAASWRPGSRAPSGSRRAARAPTGSSS